MTIAQLLELMDARNAEPGPATAITSLIGCTGTPWTPTFHGTTTTAAAAAVCVAAANELLQRTDIPSSKAAITSVPGAVRTLVSLLQDLAMSSTAHSSSRGPHICKTITALIWILSIDHQQNQESIGADSQAIPALVALLASQDPDTRMNAVGTLTNLCSSSEQSRARLGQVPGAVAALVGLLGDESAAVRKYSAQILGKLADVCSQANGPVNASIGVRLDAAGPASEPCRSTTLGPSLEHAATVAAPAGAQATAEVAGGIPGDICSCVMSTSRCTPERAERSTIPLHDWDCSLIQPAADATAATAATAAQVEQVQQTPVCSSRGIQGTTMISKLVGLLQDDDAGVRAQAANALRTFGRSISSKARISAEIAFSPGAIISSEVLLAGSMTLHELVQQLCLTADASGTVKLSAAAELCRKAGTAEDRAAVAADAVLQAVVIQRTVAMIHDPIAALRKHGAGILCGLCTGHAEHQQQVGREPGAITALTGLLKDEVSGVTRQALGAVAALAKDNAPNQMQMACEAGAVKALCRVLSDDTAAEATRRLAASMLLELNSNASSRSKVAMELPPGAAMLMWRFSPANEVGGVPLDLTSHWKPGSSSSFHVRSNLGNNCTADSLRNSKCKGVSFKL